MRTLELTLQRKTSQGWPVIASISSEAEHLQRRREGWFKLDQKKFFDLFDPREQGEMLGKALFRDDLRDAFTAALSEAAVDDGYLRVLLSIEADDLRALDWQTLCAPFSTGWDFLSVNQRTPFSLYLPSQTDRRFPPIGRRDLRALVLVAGPEDLSGNYKLGKFDIPATVASVRAALGEIPCEVLASCEGKTPTLDALCEQITAERFTLLHIVCHGAYNKTTGDTTLFFPKSSQGGLVTATELIDRLKRLNSPLGLPQFAFLSTCESADPQAETGMGGLGQRLVRQLGMPAVLAMTDKVSIQTAGIISTAFYSQLRKHGEADRALAEALGGLQGRHDLTVPALFSRLGGRPLFSDTLERPLTVQEIEAGLVELEKLIPQRAPVLMDEVRELARRLRSTLGAELAALGGEARQTRATGLDSVNQLCGEVLELSFNALSLGQKPPVYDDRPPFRGLYSFRPENKAFFFGRDPLVQRLVERLRQHSFLAVLGPSGSGKSSVVMAGLVPALDVSMAYLTPSAEPLARLETALKENAGNALIVVDQFEEIFTLTTNADERQKFIRRLLELQNSRRVVVTMRADFWGEVASHPALKDAMQAHQELIGPMDSAELRRAMEQQAAVVGLRFESDLAQTILDAVRDEPGAMPLLQHALLLLWNRRHGRWLRAEEYRNLGGVQQAIAHTADEVYNALGKPDQERVRDIFVRLTRLDETGGAEARDTRRRVGINELVPAGAEARETVLLLNRLADARLVVKGPNPASGQDEVEVAHEALIRYWPRLRHWLDEDRAGLRLRESVRENALEWENHARDESFLDHRGARLDDAVALSKLPRFALNQREQAYLDACVALRQRTRQAAERRRRWTVGISLGAALAMAVLGIWGFTQGQIATSQKVVAEARATEAFYAQATAEAASNLAEIKQQEAEAETRRATAGQLALQSKSVAQEYPLRSLLLALEAVYVNRQAGEPVLPEAEEALRAANQTVTGIGLPGFAYEVAGVYFSPDNQWLLATSYAGEYKIWQMQGIDTQQDLQTIYENKLQRDNVASISSSRQTWVGLTDWVDVDTAPEASINSFLWSLSILDQRPEPLVLEGGGLQQLFPDNENIFISSTGTQTFIWTLDPASGRVIQKQVLEGAFRFIGMEQAYIVTHAGGKGSLLWQLEPGTLPGTPMLLSDTDIYQVVYAPNNNWMVSVGDVGTYLWPLDEKHLPGERITLLADGFIQWADTVYVSESSNWLVATTNDYRTLAWNLSQISSPVMQQIALNDTEVSVIFDPTETWLIVTEKQWPTPDNPKGSLSVEFRSLDDNFDFPFTYEEPEIAQFIELSYQENWMKMNSYSVEPFREINEVYFDLSAADPAASATTIPPVVFSAGSATESATAASDSAETQSRWSVNVYADEAGSFTVKDEQCRSCPAALTLTGPESPVSTYTLSTDDKWLAGGIEDGNLRLWRLAEFPGLRNYAGDINPAWINYLAFSPDNRWMATGNLLWRLTDGLPTGEPIRLSDAQVLMAVFSPDGKWMTFIRYVGDSFFNGQTEGYLVNLENADQGEFPVPFALEFDPKSQPAVIAFSPDSNWLLITGITNPSGTQKLWNLENRASPLAYDLPVAPVDSVGFSPDSRSLIITTVKTENTDTPRTQFSRWELEPGQPPAPWGNFTIDASPPLLSTDGRWAFGGQDGILWSVSSGFETAGMQSFKVLDPDPGNNFPTFGFNPSNEFLVIAQSSGKNMVIDLKALESGKTVQQSLWGEYSTELSGFPVGSPASKWFAQGPINSGIGTGATLPWYSGVFNRMPWTSTLVGRGLIYWGGGGGGGGGIGSFKVDYAVGLIDAQSTGVAAPPKIISLRGHEGEINSLLVSPDDQWLLTLAEVPRLWNLPQMARDPNTHPVILPLAVIKIRSIGFTADSRYLVIVTDDNLVHFWSTRLDDLIEQACQAVGRNFIINEWERYFPGQDYHQTCPNLPVHPSVQGNFSEPSQ